MTIVFMAVCALCFAAFAYLICKVSDLSKDNRKIIEEHERNLVCLADALVKTNKNVADITLKFSKVDDLIDAAKDRETKAAQSEKLFQDGFSSIMNYDFSVAMGKKNDDG